VAPTGDTAKQIQGAVDEATLAAALAAAGVGTDADDTKSDADTADTSNDAAQSGGAMIAVVLPVTPAQQPVVTTDVADAGVDGIIEAPGTSAAPPPAATAGNTPAMPSAEQAKLATQAARTSKDGSETQQPATGESAEDAPAEVKTDTSKTTAPKTDGVTVNAKADQKTETSKDDAKVGATKTDAAPAEPAKIEAAKADTEKKQPGKTADGDAAHRAEPAQPHKKGEPATPAVPATPQHVNAGTPPHTPAIFHLIAGQDMQLAGAPTASQQVQVINVTLAAVPIEIATQAKEGNSRFEIRLDPPELGRIDVRLDVDSHGKVTSHLTVERVETLDLLKRDAPQLERALQDAGLKTGDSGLQFSLRDQNFAGRDNQQQPRHGAQNFLLKDDEAQRTDAAARLYGRPAGASGVDIRV
jgi:chemotaxis protein MotD